MELSKNDNTIQILDRIFEPYLHEGVILNRVAVLANELNNTYQTSDPLFVSVLNGSFMFASDLLKSVHIKSRVSFIKVASYEGVQSTGSVNQLVGLTETVKDKHIVIIEDIIDTGKTIHHIINTISAMQPASVKVVTLLFKPSRLQVDVSPDYYGFEVPDKFLLGYGLDYDGYSRNLRHIYTEKTH